MEVRPAAPFLQRLSGRGQRVVSSVGALFNSGRAQRLQPERRSGVRIITLKNAGWLALSVAVLFFVFSAYMERRSHGRSDFGRLYDSRIDEARAPSPAARPEVILEAPEQPAGERGVLQNGRGDLLLEATESAEPAAVAPAPAAARRPVRLRRDGGRVVITGGTDGVRVDPQPAPSQPELGRVPPATTTEPPSPR
jgi:hypothetical protein